MILAIVAEYSTYSKGPKTDPWGNPHFKGRCVDLLPCSWTNCFRVVKYDLNQVRAVPLIPKRWDSLDNSIE